MLDDQRTAMAKKAPTPSGTKTVATNPARLPSTGMPEPTTSDPEVDSSFVALQAIEQGQWEDADREIARAAAALEREATLISGIAATLSGA